MQKPSVRLKTTDIQDCAGGPLPPAAIMPLIHPSQITVTSELIINHEPLVRTSQCLYADNAQELVRLGKADVSTLTHCIRSSTQTFPNRT
eukprot:29158-Eustigmatos_ZCMA.PRE.1